MSSWWPAGTLHAALLGVVVDRAVDILLGEGAALPLVPSVGDRRQGRDFADEPLVRVGLTGVPAARFTAPTDAELHAVAFPRR